MGKLDIRDLFKLIKRNRRVIMLLVIVTIELVSIYLCGKWINTNVVKVLKSAGLFTPGIIPILIAAPIALLLWYWRDQDKSKDIYNVEKSHQYSDFYKMQEWVASENNQHLKTIGVRRLKHYLAQDDDLKRQAWESYKILLDEWVTEHQDVEKNQNTGAPETYKITPPYIEAIHEIITFNFAFLTFLSKERLLRDTNLSFMSYEYLELENFDLIGVTLFKSTLFSPNCKKANLSYCRIEKSDLNGGVFESTNFNGAQISDSNLSGSNFDKASINASQIKKVRFDNSTFKGADLGHSEIIESVFIGCDFENATLNHTSFENSELRGIKFCCADLTGAHLLNADLTDANFAGANLSQTTLLGANLSNCSFDNTQYSEYTKFPDGFEIPVSMKKIEQKFPFAEVKKFRIIRQKRDFETP